MNPPRVVDCSMVLAWCFEDEQTDATRQLFDEMADGTAIVPSLWFVEVANALATSERKRRITPRKSAEFVDVLDMFDIEIDDDGVVLAYQRLVPFCRLYGLTAYDAAYLELAVRRKSPLASLDESLRGAARKLGVEVLGS